MSVALPGPSFDRSYLSLELIIEAAQRSQADADPSRLRLSLGGRQNWLWPANESGLAWVGPPAPAMKVMGHKATAKATVHEAGVPILPGAVVGEAVTRGPALDELGASVGFPLLVKASAGGGGRGMRLVDEPSQLEGAVVSARREALASFGSDDVFLERYLAAPRHIEVQILADQHGRVLHLFDRECSVQRRHQKVVEEAPAMAVALATRERMWQAAVDAAQAVNYVGVGTVEFLVDGTDCFFLEMNTRLQVEHGVTEMITGLDLVQLQLLVAGGAHLPFGQGSVHATGHAVEVRLCAERPSEDYRPTPGLVQFVEWPSGEGVRTDAGVESGSVVTPSYDSLVAKIMASGPDRDVAVGRLHRAVVALALDGLETNRQLLSAVLADDEFKSQRATTDYLDHRPDLVMSTLSDTVRRTHAAAAALHMRRVRAEASLVPEVPGQWRNVGTDSRTDELVDRAGSLHVGLRREPNGSAVLVDGERIGISGPDVEVDGVAVRHRVRWHHGLIAVNGMEGQSTFTLALPGERESAGLMAGECRAPLPGSVAQVLVQPGDEVDDGTGLVVVEAMKMEHTLRASGPGIVAEIRIVPGQQVDMGDLLIVVEPRS